MNDTLRKASLKTEADESRLESSLTRRPQPRTWLVLSLCSGERPIALPSRAALPGRPVLPEATVREGGRGL